LAVAAALHMGSILHAAPIIMASANVKTHSVAWDHSNEYLDCAIVSYWSMPPTVTTCVTLDENLCEQCFSYFQQQSEHRGKLKTAFGATTNANRHTEHKSSCTNNYVQYQKDKLKFESFKASPQSEDSSRYPAFKCQFHSRMEKAHYCPIFKCHFKEDINRWTNNVSQKMPHKQLEHASSDSKIVKGEAGRERLDHAVNTVITLSTTPATDGPPSKIVNISSFSYMSSNLQLQTKGVAAYHVHNVSKMRTLAPSRAALTTSLSNNAATAATATSTIFSDSSFISVPTILQPFSSSTTTPTDFASGSTILSNTKTVPPPPPISQTTPPTLAAAPKATLADSVALSFLTIFAATATTTNKISPATANIAESVSSPDKAGMSTYVPDSESTTSHTMTRHVYQASPAAVAIETEKSNKNQNLMIHLDDSNQWTTLLNFSSSQDMLEVQLQDFLLNREENEDDEPSSSSSSASSTFWFPNTKGWMSAGSLLFLAVLFVWVGCI